MPSPSKDQNCRTHSLVSRGLCPLRFRRPLPIPNSHTLRSCQKVLRNAPITHAYQGTPANAGSYPLSPGAHLLSPIKTFTCECDLFPTPYDPRPFPRSEKGIKPTVKARGSDLHHHSDALRRRDGLSAHLRNELHPSARLKWGTENGVRGKSKVKRALLIAPRPLA